MKRKKQEHLPNDTISASTNRVNGWHIPSWEYNQSNIGNTYTISDNISITVEFLRINFSDIINSHSFGYADSPSLPHCNFSS